MFTLNALEKEYLIECFAFYIFQSSFVFLQSFGSFYLVDVLFHNKRKTKI